MDYLADKTVLGTRRLLNLFARRGGHYPRDFVNRTHWYYVLRQRMLTVLLRRFNRDH